MDTDADVTPELDEFIAAYEKDDNVWWAMASGHHQNLFDAMWERCDERLVVIAGLSDVINRLEILSSGQAIPMTPGEDVLAWARRWLERHLEATMAVPPSAQEWG